MPLTYGQFAQAFILEANTILAFFGIPLNRNSRNPVWISEDGSASEPAFDASQCGSVIAHGRTAMGGYGAISRVSVMVFERLVPLKNREGIQVFPATGAEILTVTVGVIWVMTEGVTVTFEFVIRTAVSTSFAACSTELAVAPGTIPRRAPSIAAFSTVF